MEKVFKEFFNQLKYERKKYVDKEKMSKIVKWRRGCRRKDGYMMIINF